LIQKGADLTKLSQGIKTTEFWTASAFDNLIGQISYTQPRDVFRIVYSRS